MGDLVLEPNTKSWATLVTLGKILLLPFVVLVVAWRESGAFIGHPWNRFGIFLSAGGPLDDRWCKVVRHGNCFLHTTLAGAEVIWVVLIFLTGKVLAVLTAGGACNESRGARQGVGTGSGAVMGVIWDALGAVIGFLWDGLSTCASVIDRQHKLPHFPMDSKECNKYVPIT